MTKKLKTTREVILHTSHYVKGAVLDLGAGTAKYAKHIKPLAEKYVTYDMVAGPNIDIVGDIHQLALPDQSFDTVISTQVLEHVRQPWVVAGQIARVLRPGGICVVSAPFLVSFHADPYDYFRYTKEGMASLFEGQGLEILESGTYGGVFLVLSELIHFAWANPYQAKINPLGKLVHRLLTPLLSWLDNFSDSRTIYANTFVVARKTS